MGLIRLLFILAVLAAVAWLLRDVLKRLGSWLDGGGDVPETPPRPQLVALERSAWSILGLEEGASPFEIERAYRKIMADNAPDKVAESSPQVQELATRLREDATRAYRELMEDDGAEDVPDDES